MTVPNSLKNNGWGRVSEDGLTDFPRTQDEEQKPLVDQYGRLFTRSIPFDPSFTTRAQAKSGAALVTQQHIATGLTRIVGFAGYNAEPTSVLFHYIQMHNAAGAIIANAVPDIVIPVPGNFTSFSYSLPFTFALGLTVAISTTPLLFTVPAANYLFFSIVYETA